MRTQALLDRLVEELTHNCGDSLAAARTCGVSLQFVRAWAKDDKITAEALHEATLVGTQGLVSAAIERGVNGYKKDVYYKGNVVGQETIYSDTLLVTLLKAKVDDFKPGNENTPQITVNVANIMPRANTYEEWLSMRDVTNAPKAIAAPSAAEITQAIDVDFEVLNNSFLGITL